MLTQTRGWQDALDAQMEIYGFWATQTGHRYAKGFTQDVRQKNPFSHYARSLNLLEEEREKLLKAEPIYVDPDMLPLIEAGLESFKAEILVPEDLVTPMGCMVLPAPMYQTDVHGKRFSYRVVSWMPVIMANAEGEPTGAGVQFSLYTHRDDPDDYTHENIPWEKDLSIKWYLSHAATLRFWDEDFLRDKFVDLTFFRNFQVINRMAQQRIAVADRRQPSRPLRRAAKRLDLPTQVTVVSLRRRSFSEREEEGEVNWTHRWLVRGFWRNQWFPSEKRHRQIWISDYIKGPEDKPLVIKRRAWEWVR